MMRTANHTVDPVTITVRVPIVFRRRSSGKTVITTEGSPAVTAAHARNKHALVRAIARAFRWRKLIETGVYATAAEIAVAERVNDSYVSRVLRLTLLAPDIVEAALDHRGPTQLGLEQAMRPFSMEWERQRICLP